MSSESSSCLIDWRPSRWLRSALIGLGMLAAVSLWMSALPLLARAPLALLALAYGPWLAAREARRPACTLRLASDGVGLVMLLADRSLRLSAPTVLVRGPLACVSGTDEDGRRQRLLWWPDTLAAPSRRQLRLASGRQIGESGPALATMSG